MTHKIPILIVLIPSKQNLTVIFSKSFINNECARNAHLHSKAHFRKLNNWLHAKGFKSVLYKEQ